MPVRVLFLLEVYCSDLGRACISHFGVLRRTVSFEVFASVFRLDTNLIVVLLQDKQNFCGMIFYGFSIMVKGIVSSVLCDCSLSLSF